MAGDGKWYPPESHPEAASRQSTGAMSETTTPGAPPASLDEPGTGSGPPQRGARRKARPKAVVIGVVVGLVVLGVLGPVLGGLIGHLSRHSPSVPASDSISVPSSPPHSLVGQIEDPGALAENSQMMSYSSLVASISSSSFASCTARTRPRRSRPPAPSWSSRTCPTAGPGGQRTWTS
jgi:hypothetical protein